MEARHGALLEALSVPGQCYPPLQLGLANLPGIPQGEAVAALQEYRAALEERQSHTQEGWDRQKPLPYFVEAMFDYSITLIEAEKSWIEKLIQRIEEGGYF